MADLYTSLVAAKMAMNGGEMPPMTPLSEKARRVVRPEYTIGMGGFREDARRGLQCPVCGGYYHNLGTHLGKQHSSIGGSKAVREALDVPKTAPLISRVQMEKQRAAKERLIKSGHWAYKNLRPPTCEGSAAWKSELQSRVSRETAVARRSIGFKNLLNACPAQVKQRLVDLTNKLGREPVRREAEAEWGGDVTGTIVRLYGSWASVLAQAGMRPAPTKVRGGWMNTGGNKFDIHDILPVIQAWYDEHGELPSSKEWHAWDTTPMRPSRNAVYHAFGTESWIAVMQRAAALLNIYGGRYGLPIEHKPAA